MFFLYCFTNTRFYKGAFIKRYWIQEGLIKHFAFLPNEIRLIGNKTEETRLGFAILLKFY